MELLPQYIYSIKGQCMSKYKIGRWRGSVSKLQSRYQTVYGWGFDMILFQTDDSIQAEKQLFRILKPHHWRNELYEVTALPSFLGFGVEFCKDSTFSTDMLLKNTVHQEKQHMDMVARESQARIAAITNAIQDSKACHKRKKEEENQEAKRQKIEEGVGTKARKDWRKVCSDIASMRQNFDNRNIKEQQAAEKEKLMCSFVECFLVHTGNDGHYIERSSVYEVYKTFARNKPQLIMGKKEWFDRLQFHLGQEGYHPHPRVDEGRRPRDVWFMWTLADP